MCQHVKKTKAAIVGSPGGQFMVEFWVAQKRVNKLQKSGLMWRNRFVLPIEWIRTWGEIGNEKKSGIGTVLRAGNNPQRKLVI